MKILIATGIYPPDGGGPATIMQALVPALEEKGFLIKVLTYAGESYDDGKLIKISRAQNKMAKYLKYFFRMLVLSFWADVIYVTDNYSVGYFAYLIKKMTGKKYILRFAGDSAWETALVQGWTSDYIVDFQEKSYNARIEKMKSRRKTIMVCADEVIAVSNFMADLTEKIGVARERISVIYNSIDFIRTENESETKSEDIREKFGKDAKIIVTACRLVPWKGVDGIIRALPSLIKKIGNVCLLVLGDGPALGDFKKLATELGVEKSVYFLGKYDRKTGYVYFRSADLFILNSNYEGFSVTLLEAMEAGVPIVASRSGGNPETIKDGKDGILVDYNNVNQLTEVSAKILTDNALADSFRKNAREKLKMFKWSDTVEKTIFVIKKTIGENQ